MGELSKTTTKTSFKNASIAEIELKKKINKNKKF